MLRSEQERSIFKKIPMMSVAGILAILGGSLILLQPLKNV
jgi:hypothetical protein